MKRNLIVGGVATALIVAGCLLAYPGQDGRHLAGLVLMISGINLVLVRLETK